MRIHCHDALADILYKALSQDYFIVLKEQRVSYNDGLQSGILISSMVALPILMPPCAAL